VNPALQRLARRQADQQTDRFAELPNARFFLATVTAVTPLTVSWRGSAIAAAGACASYTPAVADRVLCVLVDNQPVVFDRII
jgi:hypothetical protein